MLTLEQIKAELADRNLANVARASKVNYGTLHRLMKGDGETTYRVVKMLSDYIESRRAA